ncbi:MAG: VWA domain-containing protein [Chloroherpetonaceae bacterium]|nr:VWA domain-containing protein [Chloroherpetonaceae bacterium]
MQKAKYEISRLLDRLGEDRIGLVIFAGEAFLQCPLTTDKNALRLFLEVASTDAIQPQGTNFRDAILESVRAFRGIESGAAASDRSQPRNKVILMFSDGEDHEGNLQAAIDAAQAEQIRIYAVGIGSDNPVPIPVLDAQGRRIDFKRNQAGIVTTAFVPDHLRALATQTGGNFYRIDAQTSGLEPLASELNSLQKAELASREYVDYDDRFQILLSMALVLLIADTLLSERKWTWTRK